jgi:hypothetical protein
MISKKLLLVLIVFALVYVTACSRQTVAKRDGPPEEIFWRIAQESLLPGERIENLTIIRSAECQLSANTKASFGYVSEWVVDYETEISGKDGSRSSSDKKTKVVALKENGEWVKSGRGMIMCTDN